MEEKIKTELESVYNEYYIDGISFYVFGAYVAAAKKRLKADLMVDIIYEIAKKEKIDLTYHTSLRLCKIFMSRGILGDRLFSHFANVENKDGELTKREEKRTAKEKVIIDYASIEYHYKEDIKNRLSDFDALFKHHNKAIKRRHIDAIR
ncbi:hypothetical protein ACE1IG_004565 [Salmonella enterica]|nr:hypothetical protein [Salmonella enterica subsp. enterica serovar Infantis]HED1482800.1 hypothetical protein [Klebsiella pneumoniae]HED2090364.1 hypothetical protein [Klebsiella pneumoniae]